MTPSISQLSNVQPYSGIKCIIVGNGSSLSITHTGSFVIPSSTGSLTMHNVLVVPALKKNLLSIQRFSAENNRSFEFDDIGFLVKDKSTIHIRLCGCSKNGLYHVHGGSVVLAKTLFA